MISKEFIESFEKVLEYYKIEKEDVFDIVRAISFSESEGTHPIRLKDLASSGVDYFSDIVFDKTNSKPLPDARLARVMVDGLSVILYVTNNSLFSSPDMISVLTASSDSVHKVCQKVVNYYNPSRANHLKFDKTSNYRTLEESERDMKRLLSTCKEVNTKDIDSLHELLSFINSYCSTKYDFKNLKLPEQYRGSFDDIYFCKTASYIKTNTSLLDCITTCLLEYIIGNTDKLKLSLLITTKARYINVGKKLILKIHADKYALIRQDSFLINAFNTAFTFTHADSLQNLDSIKLLYALLFSTSIEAKRLGKEKVFGR